MSWNTRLTEARNARGLRKGEFARQAGVSAPTVTDWESGEIQNLSAEKLMAICAVLKIRHEWLMYGRGQRDAEDIIRESRARFLPSSNVEDAPSSFQLVPVISWVAAGAWHSAVDNYSPGDAEFWIPSPVMMSPSAFALRVIGDSMTPKYQPGYLILVDPEQRGGVVCGDPIVARLTGTDEVTFKILAEDAGRKFLKPLNQQYPTITDPFEIIGKVIRFVGE